jgi:hypothetical protein
MLVLRIGRGLGRVCNKNQAAYAFTRQHNTSTSSNARYKASKEQEMERGALRRRQVEGWYESRQD